MASMTATVAAPLDDRVEPKAVAPTPARGRLLVRARRSALTVVLGVVCIAGASSWLTTVIVVETSDGRAAGELWRRLALAHLIPLSLLAAMAFGLARRSTRFIEAVFRQEDRLIRAVGHEIRNPLGRIRVAVDEGRLGLRSPDDAFVDVAAEVDGLAVLVDDLALVAQVLTGKEPPPHEDVELGALAKDLVPSAASGEATVEVQVEPGVVSGSARLLRLMVTNLVRNAAQHAYQGGPGVIRIRTHGGGLVVSDDGPGLRTARGDVLVCGQPLGSSGASVGLGLSLAGWVAELHGGRLVLRNRPTGGVDACVELPVRTSHVTQQGDTTCE